MNFNSETDLHFCKFMQKRKRIFSMESPLPIFFLFNIYVMYTSLFLGQADTVYKKEGKELKREWNLVKLVKIGQKLKVIHDGWILHFPFP